MSFKNTIGILGGTSWPSTQLYYQKLNELAATELGAFHSADLLLRSIDYQEIKSRYNERWPEVPALLAAELRKLDSLGLACILIANNTLHRAFAESELRLKTPFVSIVDSVVNEATRLSARRVLLLATRFTMEGPYYKAALEELGLEVLIPSEKDREQIQRVQSELAAGRVRPQFTVEMKELTQRYPSAQALALACTELPLVFQQSDYEVPLLDSVALHCRDAFAFTRDRR